MFVNFFKIYINYLLNEFKFLFLNLYYIFISFKKTIFFIIITPVIFIYYFYLFVLCILIFFYYVLLLLFNTLMFSNNHIFVKVLDINTSYLIRHSIYRFMYLLPKSISYFLLYNLLLFYKNKFYKNFNFIITLVLFLLLILLLRYIFLFLFGFSYLVIYNSSLFVNKLFFINSLNYESKKSKRETILINCFLRYEYILFISDKKIIIEKGYFSLNPKDFDTLKNFNNIELLYKALNIKNKNYMSIYLFENNHFYYKFYPYLQKENPICTNFTSNNFIKIWKDDKIYNKVFLKYGWYPNIKNFDKYNYLTNPHITDNSATISELPQNYIKNMEKTELNALKYIISSMHNKLLYSNGLKFYDNLNITVYDYMQKNNLSIAEKMYIYDMFLSQNKEYLSTEEGSLYLEKILNEIINNNG